MAADPKFAFEYSNPVVQRCADARGPMAFVGVSSSSEVGSIHVIYLITCIYS